MICEHYFGKGMMEERWCVGYMRQEGMCLLETNEGKCRKGSDLKESQSHKELKSYVPSRSRSAFRLRDECCRKRLVPWTTSSRRRFTRELAS